MIEHTTSTSWGWFQVMRPKTLTASLVPFTVGAALAYAAGTTIMPYLLLCALASAFCLQIGTNLNNDAYDFSSGADNAERLGPKRAIQSNYASQKQVYLLGLTFFLAAFLFGIPLIAHGGFAIAAILIVSIAAGYAYTGGPYPLAYKGLGDLFVLLFYGWVATLAAYWLHAGHISLSAWVLGTQIGFLSTTMIAINNLRDIECDKKTNKITLAVRLGKDLAVKEIQGCLLLPFLLNLFWYTQGYFFTAFLPFLILPFALALCAKIQKTAPSKIYNQFLGQAAALHLAFGLLLMIGFILQR